MIKVDELVMSNYETETQNAVDAFKNLDSYHDQINGILSSGNWSGSAHDKCQKVIEIIYNYLSDVYKDFGEAKKNVNQLVGDVDTFVSTSLSVKKLEE